jgi:hypothetical protein
MLNSDYNEDISLTTTLSDKLKLYYSVDFVNGENGKAGIASRDYETGIVTLRVTPDPNYRVDKITVTGTNGTEDLTPVSGVYYVDTSKEDVTVTTTFKEAGNSILASGTCGDYLYWELNDEGVLTISGTGDMEYNNVPWSAYSNSIESVVISSGVTSIGENAFAGCDYLTEITIPEDVTSIGTAAFYGCPNLTNITLPESLTAIGEYAFRMCTGLTNITIPKNVTSIGRGTFDRCSSLTSITISDGVFSIGDCAFQDCTNLTSVIFPDSIASIGDAAFFGCSGLVSITLFDGMTSIGDHAFTDCSSLTDVYYFGTEEQFAAISDPIRPFTTNVNIHYLTPLEILTQPADYTGPIGSKATFSVEAEGEELKYQWQMLSNDTWKNSSASGAKTSKITFTISNIHDGMQYRCIVTDGYGNEEISEVAAVHAGTVLEITGQPEDFTGPIGSKATFSVEAKGDGLKYQWQMLFNGVWKNSSALGAKTSTITFTISNMHDGMQYRCIVTDGYGNEEISEASIVHAGTVLEITGQPEDFTGPVGSTATFSIEAEGNDLTYQWQYYSKGTWINSSASGATTSMILFNVKSSHDGMQYRCVVTDSEGNEVISDVVTVHVTAAT